MTKEVQNSKKRYSKWTVILSIIMVLVAACSFALGGYIRSKFSATVVQKQYLQPTNLTLSAVNDILQRVKTTNSIDNQNDDIDTTKVVGYSDNCNNIGVDTYADNIVDSIPKSVKNIDSTESDNSDQSLRFTKQQSIQLVQQTVNIARELDRDSWRYLNSSNIYNYVEYSFAELLKDSQMAPLIEASFDYDFTDEFAPTQSDYEQVGRQRANGLNTLLLAAGLSAAVIAVIVGCLTTVQVSAVGMWVFPPVTIPAAALAIGIALAVMTAVIIANWEKIEPILNSIKQYFLDAVGVLANIVNDFFSDTANQANKEATEVFDGTKYYVKELNQELVDEIQKHPNNKSNIYIVFGKENGKIALGVLSYLNGIKKETAVKIMQNESNQFWNSSLGYVTSNGSYGKIMVVSIYTFFNSTAFDIAKIAGYNESPEYHPATYNGSFHHYHNGKMMAQYPNIKDKLPHAFYGTPYVKPQSGGDAPQGGNPGTAPMAWLSW